MHHEHDWVLNCVLTIHFISFWYQTIDDNINTKCVSYLAAVNDMWHIDIQRMEATNAHFNLYILYIFFF